jgi:hypothetical protein
LAAERAKTEKTIAEFAALADALTRIAAERVRPLVAAAGGVIRFQPDRIPLVIRISITAAAFEAIAASLPFQGSRRQGRTVN